MNTARIIRRAALVAFASGVAAICFLSLRKPDTEAGPASDAVRPSKAVSTTPAGPSARSVAAAPAAASTTSTRNPTAPATQLRKTVLPQSIPGTASEQFYNWLRGYLAAAPEQRPALLRDGVRLAAARRVEIKQLIASDPRQALAEAVPMTARQQLPPEIVAQLEERVSGRGTLRTYLSAPPQGQAPTQPTTLRYAEIANGQTYRANVYGRRAESIRWVADTSLNGVAVDEQLAVNESPIRPLEIGEIPDPNKSAVTACPVSGKVTEAPANATTTITEATPAIEAYGQIVYLCDGSHTTIFEQTLIQGEGVTGGPQQFTGILPAAPTPSVGVVKALYIPVTFADQNAAPSSEATAYEVMRKVGDFYTKGSYGKLTLLATVTPPVKLPHDEAWYKQKDTSDGTVGNKEIDGLGLEHSHAREEARKLGYDSNDYNCVIVRLNGGPRATGGWGGGSSVWIYGDWDDVTAHEIGHVFGLAHANYWDTGGASAIGPGANQEYGNKFDVMGGGPFPKNHYNAQAKNQIRWLPTDFIQTVTTSGTYRVFAFDQPSLQAGQKYALKIQKDTQRTYWGEVRQQYDGTNNWVANGLVLGWNWPSNSGGNIQLIDTTPGSPGAKDDAPIYLGRTFSDYENGIHLTTVAVNAGDPKSVDVVVNLGTFPGNLPPTLSVAATATTVPRNTPITFTATATDPNGDPLAYAWLSSDNTTASTAIIGQNSPTFTRSFASDGQFVVTCIASDMKGGSTTKNIVVTAGTGGSRYTISGRVTLNGAGLPNALLSTGSNNATMTDSDGYYTIPGLAAGTYTVVPQLYGYTFSEQFNNSLTLGPSATGADFTADPAVTVSITPGGTAREAVTSPTTSLFTLTRTGPTAAALTVKLVAPTGSASSGDYTLTPALVSASPYNTATIPAGQSSLDLVLTPTFDTSAEGPETVTLQLGVDAAYVIAGAAAATVVIDDDDSTLPKVSVTASTIPALESPAQSATFTFTRTGATGANLVVNYTIGGTATNATDYTSIPGSVTIPSGASSATVTVTPIDDAVSESAETVILTTSTSANYLTDPTALTATVQLMDNDLQTVSLVVADASAAEVDLTQPGAIPNPGTFIVSRTGDIAQALTIYYSVTGTALQGVDYDSLLGSVTIPAGQSNASITIVPRYDTLGEGTENVFLQLGAGGTNYVLSAQSSGTVTITDAADRPYVEVITVTNAVEPATNGRFRFTAKGKGTGTLTINYTISGTATAGTDYSISGLNNTTMQGSVNVTLNDGTATADLIVTTINDALVEELETINLTIDSASTYQTWAPSASAAMWLRDDEQPSVFVDGYTSPAGGNTVAESATGTITKFWISRTGSTTNALTVNYSFLTGEGYATSGSDFTTPAGAGSITIPAGAQGIDVVVSPILQDTIVEGTEKITLHLEPGSYGRGADSTIYLTDDEANPTTVAFAAAAASGSESAPAANIAVNLNAASGSPVTVEYLVDSGSKNTTTSATGVPVLPYWVRVVRNANSFTTFYSGDGVTWTQQGSPQTITMSSTSYLAGLCVTSHNNATPCTVTFDNVSVTGLSGGGATGSLSSADIGGAAAGSTNFNAGTGVYTVVGSGSDIFNGADSFRFASFPVTNSTACTITARVVSQTNTDPWAKAGVMIRESNVAGSMHMAGVATPANGFAQQWRTTLNGSSTNANTLAQPAPCWFKLVRSGDTVTSFLSADGTNWTQLGTPQTLAIGAPALAGLVVCSTNSTTLATAVFDNVSITPVAVDSLASQDIGFLSVSGNATEASGTYTVQGAGSDIGGTADSFQFLRAPIVGDCTIIARLVSMTNTGTNAKAGLMIRENSNSYARHVCLARRSGAAPIVLTRNFTVTNAYGAGVDFTLVPGTLTFAPGETTKNISLATTNDSLPEGTETVTIVLRNPSGASLGAISTFTYSITDGGSVGPLPNIGFAAASSSGVEALATPQVFVSLSEPSATPVTVNYSVDTTSAATGGTATIDTDYTLPSGTLTFAPGETVKGIPLTVIDETTIEADETIIVTLTAPSGAVLTTNDKHTYTILDDDKPVTTIVASSPNAAEPATAGAFTVSRTGLTTNALTVNFTVATGTGQATSGTDYTSIGTSVTIPAGQASAVIPVSVINDTTIETNETVTVTLASNAAYNVGSPATATVTIADDESNVVSITASNPNASETGPTAGAFTLTRTGSTAAALTVNFTVVGTATSGSDYTSISTSKSIPVGQSSVTIAVTPINDTLTEGPESVVVSLSSSANYTIGASSFASVNIADNDSPPTVFISNPSSKAVQLASGNGLILAATATDDGAPSLLTYTWSKFSGPGTVTFGAPSSANTTAQFSASGVYILRIAANDGQFTTYDDVTVQVGGFAALDWIDVSLGSPGVRGLSGDSSGVISMLGSGTGYTGTTDSAHLSCRQITGDGAIVTRVASLTNAGTSALAGVMMRETTYRGARRFFLGVKASGAIELHTRTTVSGADTTTSGGTTTLPVWLKIERVGDVFTASKAPDSGGTPGAWTVVGTATTLALNANIIAGVSASNGSSGTLCTATFDNRTLTPTPVGAALIAEDLGNSSLIGSSTDVSGTVTINAPGDLGDGGHFRYRQYVGDVTTTARLISHTGSGFDTKGGVMIRDFSNDTAPYGMMGIAHYWGGYFVYRSTNGGSSANNYGGSNANPQWVRMIRKGGKMSAWSAPDTSGNPGTWIQRGATLTFSAGAPVYAGLAADANGSVLNTVVLSNLTVVPGNLAPVVSVGAGGSYIGTATLGGSVTDDAQPMAATVQWTQISGPGTVTFANRNAAATTATATAPGTYILRLTADDTENQTFADLSVTIFQTGFQAWQAQYFTAGDPNAAAAANIDGDGLTNLLEYAFGTSPLVANSSPVVSDTVTIGPDKFLRLTVPKNPAATGLLYEVQATSNIALPLSWSSSGLIIELNDATTLRVRDNVPLGTGTPPTRFLRVFVNQP